MGKEAVLVTHWELWLPLCTRSLLDDICKDKTRLSMIRVKHCELQAYRKLQAWHKNVRSAQALHNTWHQEHSYASAIGLLSSETQRQDARMAKLSYQSRLCCVHCIVTNPPFAIKLCLNSRERTNPALAVANVAAPVSEHRRSHGGLAPPRGQIPNIEGVSERQSPREGLAPPRGQIPNTELLVRDPKILSVLYLFAGKERRADLPLHRLHLPCSRARCSLKAEILDQTWSPNLLPGNPSATPLRRYRLRTRRPPAPATEMHHHPATPELEGAQSAAVDQHQKRIDHQGQVVRSAAWRAIPKLGHSSRTQQRHNTMLCSPAQQALPIKLHSCIRVGEQAPSKLPALYEMHCTLKQSA